MKPRSLRERETLGYKFNVLCQVYVDFVDADDVTPVFPSDVIRLEFPEDIPVSTILYVANAAVNASTEVSKVSYSLNSDANSDGYFSVDRWTGEIRLRRALDREITGFHRFSVAAKTDNGSAGYLNVLLTVLDSNDHDPVFSQAFYTCHVTSAISYRPVCAVTATDSDENENGRIVYFLLADDDAVDIFHIDPHSGAIYVNRSAPGNRTLTVVATDAGALPRKSSALVLVTSDVSPSVNCAVDSLEMKVEENQPAYSIVGSVRLVYDERTNVVVTGYHLTEDGRPRLFDIDVRTGQIVTNSLLDREQSSKHTLSVSVVYSLPGSLSSRKEPISIMLVKLHFEFLGVENF